MREESPLAGAPLFGLLSRRLQDEIVDSAHPFHLPAQDWLFRQGEAGDRVYLVVSGRLRVLAESGDETRVLSVLGPGAVLGELAVLTRAPRSASVQALRDTELLEIDGERFEDLLQRDPELGAGIARALAEKIQRGESLEPANAPTKVVTVAALPGVQADRFWEELRAGFSELGDTAALVEPDVDWDDAWSWGRKLEELERAHAYVLLRADLDASTWSSFCRRQADRVVFVTEQQPPPDDVADGGDVVFLLPPTVEDVAAWRLGASARAHYIVPSENELPGAARAVARRLTGRSLGLVLSGGGARAFAHIGVLEVLEAEGVVVDRFGGCSMGAFVGAMGALGWTPETMIEVSHRELAHRAPFSDYTFPRHALTRARRMASMLRRVLGETALEQLARPLYTVSADLYSSQMVVHRIGSVVEAVGASMAIPGLAPPVQRHAQLLVDGGVLNNLPVDIMVADEPGPVVGVDVMRRLEVGDVVAGSQLLLPTILETLSRATVLGSVERAETNRALADLLITPDVQDISLRGFRSLTQAVDAGRRAAEDALAGGGKEALEQAQRQGSRVGIAVATASS